MHILLLERSGFVHALLSRLARETKFDILQHKVVTAGVNMLLRGSLYLLKNLNVAKLI